MMNKKFLALSMLMFASCQSYLMASGPSAPVGTPRSFTQNLANAGNSLASGAQAAGKAMYNGAQTAGTSLASGAQTAGRAAYNGARELYNNPSGTMYKAGKSVYDAPGVAAQKMGHSDGKILFGENRSISSGLSFADAQASNAGSRLGIANLTGRSRNLGVYDDNNLQQNKITTKFVEPNDRQLKPNITETTSESGDVTYENSVTHEKLVMLKKDNSLIYTPALTYTNAMGRGIRSAYKKGQDGLSSAYQGAGQLGTYASEGAGQLGTYLSEGANSAYQSAKTVVNNARAKFKAAESEIARRARDKALREQETTDSLQPIDNNSNGNAGSAPLVIAQINNNNRQNSILNRADESASIPLSEDDGNF